MRSRRCSVCRKKIPAEEAFIWQLKAFCSYKHLMDYSTTDAGEKLQKRTRINDKKKAVPTYRDMLKEAQKAFNAVIRARDQNAPCISCGRPLYNSGIGGGFDAGHYRSIGSSPGTRFNYWGVRGQCKRCNRYLSGNVVEYRKNLIKIIGLDKVEAIENDNRPKRWNIEYLQRLIKICKKAKKRYTRRYTL